ncbi:putative 5xTM membrane BCR, YitT family [Caprobacter fermentans]|uniref:Putative 5xTM membrane BCR, YitT family n=1 Tax=Caproicibacter fermentans TaxID=2576756 RepID=A0A6N8I4C2_9FIRM|nr:YitT family protein [Caproicibacter fermentans]MVB12976.1 putative 5xTM membrane BCR, YitT family [Caproicibacter fermentans]QNK41246.1 YitT family protein [Caproicibacter fermentans]
MLLHLKNGAKELLLDFLYYAAASILCAVSVRMFTAPNHIAPGGVTGLSTVINYLSGLPIGMMSLLLNIPIFIWAVLQIGYKLVGKTMIATVFVASAIDILSVLIPPYSGNPMLAAIFGGLLDGTGLSLVFMRGATTGGTDLIARLLNRRVRFVSMGKLMLCVDFVIVVISAIAYRSIESALYALIAIFVSSRMIDTILYGTDVGTGKVIFIISEKSERIAQEILTDVERGVTYLDSKGAYTGRKGEVLLCAARRYEVVKIKDIVRTIDRNAFLIVGDAGEITGEGFREVRPEDKTLRELIERLKSEKK